MTPTLALLGLLYAVGFVVLAGALWRPPTGIEDEACCNRGREPRAD